MAVQINNSLEENKDKSTSRARLMSLAMSTALFLNTRTWSFPKLQLQRKEKKIASYNFLRSLIHIGVRAGGGEGGCSPPKFWATQIFWATRENLGKASF